MDSRNCMDMLHSTQSMLTCLFVGPTGTLTLVDKAHSYLNTYWDQEAPWSTATAYWPSYDNMAWAAAVLLLQQPVMVDTAAAAVAERHREALSLMFRGWLNGRVS